MLEFCVELHGTIYGLNFIVANDETLDGWVECDGQHVESALLAHHHESVIIAVAASRAVSERRRAATTSKQLQGN